MLEPTGYGLSGLGYVNALLDLNCPVHWIPLVLGKWGYRPWYQLESAEEKVEEILRHCLSDNRQIERLLASLEPLDAYQGIVMHVVPEYWPYLKEDGQIHVGYTVWETTSLPEHFPGLINQVDRVLVPSSFNLPIFTDSGVDIPIRCVPHILNPAKPTSPRCLSDLRERVAAPPNNFIFYSINTWTPRKDLWTLIHAYLASFTVDDPVSLVVKTSALGPRHSTDSEEHDTQRLVEEIVANYPRPAHIRVINSQLDNEQISALHTLGDCFVSASHAEGWGMGMFEAAGAGNPVIATGWGGHLDYLPSDLAYLADYEFTNVLATKREASYRQDQLWAQVDPKSLSSLLKQVVAEPGLARRKAETLAGVLHRDYNPSSVGKQLYQAIYFG